MFPIPIHGTLFEVIYYVGNTLHTFPISQHLFWDIH